MRLLISDCRLMTVDRRSKIEAERKVRLLPYIDHLLALFPETQYSSITNHQSTIPNPQPSINNPQSAISNLLDPLTSRELDLLRLLASGATNQEIAGQLFITVGTVKSHVNHILGKLDAHNRTEAVARARALGLLEI